MFSLTTSAFLIILYATYVSSYKSKDPGRGIRIDFKTFATDPITCHGKACSLCKYVKVVLTSISACVTFVIDPATKKVTFGVEVRGIKVISFPVSVNFSPFCQSTGGLTHHGQSGICFTSNIKETKRNSITFEICLSVYLHFNFERFAGIDFKCWKYLGNLILVNENPLKFSATISTIRILS